jgi:hypothetical protein
MTWLEQYMFCVQRMRLLAVDPDSVTMRIIGERCFGWRQQVVIRVL